MEKMIVHSNAAPAVTGFYSQAILAGDFIFTSGQLGLVPETGEMVAGLAEQTKQALINTENVLKAAGMDRNDIVKVNIYLKNMNEFSIIDATYAEFFGEHKPARCSVQVAALYQDSLVEIEVIGCK